MKPEKYLISRLTEKEWPVDWKSHFQAWLLDAAIMMAGAWIFPLIGHIILRIMLVFLR